MRRVRTIEDAQSFVDQLRTKHPSARHHCSAWVIGHDRGTLRANDDGEPSGTAGAPILGAVTRADMPGGRADLSDVVVVVMRWFGGTLLGTGGLVSAYSDSAVAVITEAHAQQALRMRQPMRHFRLPAPVGDAGRWEYELRSAHITVHGTDYTSSAGAATLELAVADDQASLSRLHTLTATLSNGTAELEPYGTDWHDAVIAS
ncbi:YigZ family protein [Nesterenkonia natronophila]|uniref:YigZ family protein n=2 Tax=Nesterenkonia natronophila TaxID=2174932 RepID=A0A3A4F130_9MICC|nr:YigZ family protein [Nesterenkonia natronophila]